MTVLSATPLEGKLAVVTGGGVGIGGGVTRLFAEAGASATDIHGRRLELNRAESTFMHHRGVCFASDVELAAQIRSIGADSA